MSIFVIIKQPGANGDLLEASVLKQFPVNYDLGNGAWLVPSNTTAEEISARVGIKDGVKGSGIVMEVGSYYGYANPAIWTWMKANWKVLPSG